MAPGPGPLGDAPSHASLPCLHPRSRYLHPQRRHPGNQRHPARSQRPAHLQRGPGGTGRAIPAIPAQAGQAPAQAGAGCGPGPGLLPMGGARGLGRADGGPDRAPGDQPFVKKSIADWRTVFTITAGAIL